MERVERAEMEEKEREEYFAARALFCGFGHIGAAAVEEEKEGFARARGLGIFATTRSNCCQDDQAPELLHLLTSPSSSSSHRLAVMHQESERLFPPPSSSVAFSCGGCSLVVAGGALSSLLSWVCRC